MPPPPCGWRHKNLLTNSSLAVDIENLLASSICCLVHLANLDGLYMAADLAHDIQDGTKAMASFALGIPKVKETFADITRS